MNSKAPRPTLPSRVPLSRASGWPYGPPRPDSEASSPPRARRAKVRGRVGDPATGRREVGPGRRGVSARRWAGKPPEEGLTSATPRATGGRAGGSRSGPPGGAFPPPLPLGLPAPSLVQPRPPSPAAPRGAVSAAAACAASPV